MMTGIPDLDAMSEDELMTFWSVYHRAGPKLAEQLFGRRFKDFTNAASALANYASNRATAMACARRGDEHGKEIYEHAMRLSFDRLPREAFEIAGHPGWLSAHTREALKRAVRGERHATVKDILRGMRSRA